MNLPYRLLALDVDGTLMNSRNELSAAHRAALHRAHDAGLKISLCTGRALAETRTVLDAIGLDLDAGIFVFGAIITELPGGRTLRRSPIPPALADRLVRFFQAHNFPLLILYDPEQAGFGYEFIHGPRNAEAYEAWMRVTPVPLRRADSWQPGRYEPVRIGIIDDPEHIADTLAKLRAEFAPGEMKFNAIYAPNYQLHVVECFSPEVNKWHGLEMLCQLMGISGSEVVALGDDVNDVEMISSAGLGVAMGNAVEAVRSVARLQVATNDAGGVAELIDRLLAGQIPLPQSQA